MNETTRPDNAELVRQVREILAWMLETEAEVDRAHCRAYDLLPALAEAVERYTWKPIAEAPRVEDGETQLLGYRKAGDAYWVIRWSENRQGWIVPGTNSTVNPDYFMEIPAGPNLDDKQFSCDDKWDGCEWNPSANRSAIDTDEHSRAVRAEVMLGSNVDWRVCRECASLPRFSKYKVRKDIIK